MATSSELLKGGEDNEYQLVDKKNVFHRFVNTQNVNIAAYVAGIIEASLTVSGFDCKVSAYHQTVGDSPVASTAAAKRKAASQQSLSTGATSERGRGTAAIPQTGLILVVKFDQRVMQRGV